MSVKSRNRTRSTQSDATRAPLASQKQAIHAAMLDHGITAMICFVYSFILPGFLLVKGEWSALYNTHPFILFFVILFLCCFGYFLLSFIRCFIIHRKLRSIPYASAEPVSIRCCKVSFLFKHESRSFSKIVCIIFKDTHGNRFCYVYPKKVVMPDSFKREIKAYFTDRDITLTCYKGTNMVKTLPNTPKYWPYLPARK